MMILDPVCMMTCYPHLLANFIYKPPPLAGRPLAERAMFLARHLCSRDLVIAQAFCRRCGLPATPCIAPCRVSAS